MTDDTLTAELAQILKRHEELRSRYGHVGGLLVLTKAKDDVPRLLAAVEAVLKQADDWGAEAVKAEDRAQLASERGDNTACAVLYARATALNQNARGLREAITRELSREGGGDGS